MPYNILLSNKKNKKCIYLWEGEGGLSGLQHACGRWWVIVFVTLDFCFCFVHLLNCFDLQAQVFLVFAVLVLSFPLLGEEGSEEATRCVHCYWLQSSDHWKLEHTMSGSEMKPKLGWCCLWEMHKPWLIWDGIWLDNEWVGCWCTALCNEIYSWTWPASRIQEKKQTVLSKLMLIPSIPW